MIALRARQVGPLTLLAILLVVVWLAALMPRQLAKTDEGRYAEISREMVTSGDWLTPRLDGIKYFEKPALQYWATAVADEAFGLNEFSARLWTGLMGLVGLLAIGLAASRVYGRSTAVAAVAVLASSMLYLLIGHIDTLDMGLTGFMSVTLAGLLVVLFAPPSRQHRHAVLIAWAASGLAILSKGLIGLLLPSMVTIASVLLARDWQQLARLRIPTGLLVILIITAPWFIAVSMVNPEFAHFFFIHEHLERFLTHEHNRVGPWWYFLPVLAFGALPWTSLLPQALYRAMPGLPGQRTLTPRVGVAPLVRHDADIGLHARADRFLLLWAVLIFLFFSLSGSKLPSYILPIMPALAILVARALRHAPLAQLVGHARLIALLALIGGLLGLFAEKFSDRPEDISIYTQFGHLLALGCLVLVVSAWCSARLFAAGHRQRGVLLLAGAALISGVTGIYGYGAFDHLASAAYVAAQIAPRLGPTTPIYSIEMYEQTLPFYLKRTLILVNHRDELDFGLQQEPGRWISSLDQFAARWRLDPSAVAVMPPSSFAKLRAMNLPMSIVLSDHRFIVIAKP